MKNINLEIKKAYAKYKHLNEDMAFSFVLQDVTFKHPFMDFAEVIMQVLSAFESYDLITPKMLEIYHLAMTEVQLRNQFKIEIINKF